MVLNFVMWILLSVIITFVVWILDDSSSYIEDGNFIEEWCSIKEWRIKHLVLTIILFPTFILIYIYHLGIWDKKIFNPKEHRNNEQRKKLFRTK